MFSNTGLRFRALLNQIDIVLDTELEVGSILRDTWAWVIPGTGGGPSVNFSPVVTWENALVREAPCRSSDSAFGNYGGRGMSTKTVELVGFCLVVLISC